MARRGGLLLGVVGFNLVLLSGDRYAFVMHLPIIKLNKYFFRKLKGMDNIHKGVGKCENNLEKSGKFVVRKKWEPC